MRTVKNKKVSVNLPINVKDSETEKALKRLYKHGGEYTRQTREGCIMMVPGMMWKIENNSLYSYDNEEWTMILDLNNEQAVNGI